MTNYIVSEPSQGVHLYARASSKNPKTPECIPALIRAGIAPDDAYALRRIAMTLSAWAELECGSERGAIERDEKTGKPYWYNPNAGTRRQIPVADRERGALKRLQAIMARYPALRAYHQGDPRGAALYILRPGDVPEGEDVDAYYSRGIAVYK